RIADLARDLEPVFFGRDTARTARHDRQSRFVHRATRFDLVAHQPNHVRGWSNELDVASLADLSEVSRLGEEAVARMDRIDVEDLSGADDGRNVEITLRRGRWPNARRFISEPHVQR